MSLSVLKDQFAIDDELFQDPWYYLTARYRGAVVEIFERGIFRGDIKHVDVSSMYPNIMIVFNLSPESVRLVKTKPYTGQYIFSPTYIEVPDEVLNMQVCIAIDEDDSISRRILSDFYARRQEYRAKKEPGWFGNQLTMKIFMNAMYGYNGMEWSRYGSFLVAIATAAIGRFIIKLAENWLREKGLRPLELDTDGIYEQGQFDPAELTAYIQERFKEFPLRDKLRLDTNDYDGMIVVMMKNYVLLKGETMIFKGSGFRGRGIPKVAENARTIIARALFEGRALYSAWSLCIERMMEAPLQNFEMSVQPTKPKEEYAEGNLYRKLLEQVPQMEWGEEVRYVRTWNRYAPVGVQSDETLRAEIDYNYYHGRMKSVAERLLEPMVGVDEQIAEFYQWVFKSKKARKCANCDVRLNKSIRWLDTDYCRTCAEVMK